MPGRQEKKRTSANFAQLKRTLNCGLSPFFLLPIKSCAQKLGWDSKKTERYLKKLGECNINGKRNEHIFCFILANVLEAYKSVSTARFQFSRDNMKKVKKLLELTRWFNKNYTYEHVIMKRPLSVRHVMCDAEDVLEDVMKTAQQRKQMPRISWNEFRDMNIACLVSCLVVDCGKSPQEAMDTLAFLYEQHPCNSDRRVLKSSTIKTIVKREFERLLI